MIPKESVTGEWIGPPRKGLDHINGPCSAKYGRRLRIIHPAVDETSRIMIKFDNPRLPQSLACFQSDVLLDPRN